jgi:hypothetical protein
VSALAHWLEEEGLATTMISLVGPQSDAVGPPRALWVPFELGRPLGAPDDPRFQRHVLLAMLELLLSDEGPVLRVDFPDDAPGARPRSSWTCPLVLPPLRDPGNDPETVRQGLAAELAAVRPAYERARAARGRTTVGIGELEPDAVPAYLAAFLGPERPASPREDLSAIMTLRFALDDLRAYYTEAAVADDAQPSSTQLADWFWNGTFAGRVIRAVRLRCLESDDRETVAVATGALAPRSRV